ncbi:ubiquinone biosynthesis monooxygenase COQ6-like isoform X2 [Leptotrombidium deliense]|uniref:Ubiquinone biosynthesis monooxygenase COQ6-like isoform X2 n=1 Tax=Leptotrombidium deliense TaxID=299467 RepID=A0A443SH08_9ACAR|nr:ubiquinone biosynthesis monooxygenase COQ6-like isoform X2 [Leptotrombidium deliense]
MYVLFGEFCVDAIVKQQIQYLRPTIGVEIVSVYIMLLRAQRKQIQYKTHPESQKNVNKEPFDIVVNGGGIVGLSFLLALRKSPFLQSKRVLLLEQTKQQKIDTVPDLENKERLFSNRVSSLTLSSKRFFETLDVWSDIEPFTKTINSMYVWSHDFYSGITFNPSTPSLVSNYCFPGADRVESNVCYVVENNHILNALNKAVPKDWVRFESSLTDLKENGSNVDVVVNGVDSLTTSLLVASDGFNSFVRKNCNLKYFEHDLNQNAIVGTVEVANDLENDTNDVAYQRFVLESNSIFALLPLSENFSSFVLSVPKGLGEQLMKLSDEEFVDALNQALFSTYRTGSSFINNTMDQFNKVVKSLLPSGGNNRPPRQNPPQLVLLDSNSRSMYPLRFGTTLPYLIGSPKGGHNNKIVIIGDACHRIHPLAGQGLNLGLGDAEVLAECLHKSLSRGEKLFGSDQESADDLRNALFDFENNRQKKLMVMLAAIHGMQNTFQYVPSSFLSVFNSLNFVKNEVVKFANSN